MSELLFEQVGVDVGRGRSQQTILKGVDLRVRAGEVVGLVGESGSGKSTLAKCAVGLMEPARGRILLDGVEVSHSRSAERVRIQLIFQDPHSCLNPRRTVGASLAEAVSTARRLHATDRRKREVEQEAHRLLDLVGLPRDYAERLPRELSGGQRQRVAIARALGAEPDVILADEITSALDVSVQGAILNVLRDLHQQVGFTMLFISHNLAVVRLMSDRVAVMRDGQIVEEGPVLEVLQHPRADYTKRLLASIPHW